MLVNRLSLLVDLLPGLGIDFFDTEGLFDEIDSELAVVFFDPFNFFVFPFVVLDFTDEVEEVFVNFGLESVIDEMFSFLISICASFYFTLTISFQTFANKHHTPTQHENRWSMLSRSQSNAHFAYNQQTAPSVSRTVRPVRQGWILKRAGSAFLAQWRLKYIVLTVLQTSSKNRDDDEAGVAQIKTKAYLQIFDQIDQSKPPKHEIHLDAAQIEVIGDDGMRSNVFSSMWRKGAYPFTIHTPFRRVSHFVTMVYLKYNPWV
jgi:hypothetical protein